MMTIAAVIVISYLLRLILVFRAAAGRQFRTASCRLLPAGTSPPSAAADLYSHAEQELAVLGFGERLWLLIAYEPADGNRYTFFGVYRNREASSLAWLSPPSDLRAPNRLQVFFTTRLSDGRTLTSQAFDPYFEVVATAEAPGQTIGGDGLQEQWAQHLEWRRSFAVDADRNSLLEADIVLQAGYRNNQQITRLLDRGSLRKCTGGEIRASLRFAIRLVLAIRNRPQPAPDHAPVPPARLALLAGVMERARQINTPPGIQWFLFAVSLTLILAASALIWDWIQALILLAVVVLHESGHYMGMRAFGYRNVQMRMLPLVGGVSVGHEEVPSASQRAWISLMGPLPGILLGWMLLGYGFTLVTSSGWQWVTQIGLTLLIVNYLNVLPIPPLDGGRLVQAMLPLRWFGVQSLLVAATCVLGAFAAADFGMPLVALLALASLLSVPRMWQNGRVLRQIAASSLPARLQPRSVRLRCIFEAFEVHGPAIGRIQSRIQQAEAVLDALDTPAMRLRQRLALALTYLLVLLAPVLMLSYLLWFLPMVVRNDTAAGSRIYENVRQEKLAESSVLAIPQLVARLDAPDGQPFGPPADDRKIEDTESRLHAQFPDSIRQLYASADGIPALGIEPLANLQRTGTRLLAEFRAAEVQGGLLIDRVDGEPLSPPQLVAPGRLADTILFAHIPAAGDDGEPAGNAGAVILLDPDNPPIFAAHTLLQFGHGRIAVREDIKTWLSRQWAEQEAGKALRQAIDSSRHRARLALAEDDVSDLIDTLRPAGFAARLMHHQPGWPAPVGAFSARAAETRLGLSLPEDYLEFLRLHDGLPALGLMPLEEIAYLSPVLKSEQIAALPGLDGKTAFAPVDDDGSAPLYLDQGIASQCIAIGGPRKFATAAAEAPQALWCPRQPNPEARYVDLPRHALYPDFTSLLRDRVAGRIYGRYMTPSAGASMTSP